MAIFENAFTVDENGINLNDTTAIVSDTTDPSTGLGQTAPIGSVFLRTNGVLYIKTAAGDTNWTTVPNSADLAAGYQPLDADLTGLAALATTGIMIRTGAGTFTTRTITGTANQITLANGDGIAANPTISITSNPILPGVASVTVPTGLTTDRPGSPTVGMIRFNTTLGVLEFYQSAAWRTFSTVTSLDDLSDVIITAPVAPQALRYNGTNWVNQRLITNDIALDSVIGSPVVLTDLEDELDFVWSSGSVTGFNITDNGDGTVNVATGEMSIRISASETADLRPAAVAGVTNLAMTINNVNFIYVDYNAGTPLITSSTNFSTLNGWDKVLLYVITREGTELHIIDSRQQSVDVAKKIRVKAYDVARIEYVLGGSILTSPSGLTLAVTAGAFYAGLSKIPHGAFDTSVAGLANANIFRYYYRDGVGGWTLVPNQKTINNTQFDNGSGTLATLTGSGGNRRFKVDWVYLIQDTVSPHLAVVYSQGEYTNISNAEAATPPQTLPPSLEFTGILLGRVIIRKGDAAFTSVQSAFFQAFSMSGVTDHNQLGGLQGGTLDEYFHLTSTQHTNLSPLGDVATTGVVVRTGSGTWATRTITGTTNQITLTNGDGVAANPTVSLPSTVETGNFRVTSATTSYTSTTGTAISVIPGAATNATSPGNTLTLQGGPGGGTSGAGGAVTLTGGIPVAGAGGAVTISGSAGVGTNQNGGAVIIQSGAVTGAGTGSTITFNTNGATQQGQFTQAGSLVLGNAAIATNATDGFLYITASAGTPTGVPTTFTGRSPIEVDSTNNLLYFYSGGAWRTSFAGGVTTFSAGTTGFTPNSPTAGAITLAGTLIAANGGTGFNTYAVGDLLYADTTTTLARLPDVATGNALISGGVNTAPLWGKIGLTTHVSGTLGIGNGGTGTASTPTNGQILIGNGTNYTLSTITQTANQVTVTNGVGSITLSTPSTFIAPGTIASTTTITAGSNFIASTATTSYTSTTGTAISVIPGAATNATSAGNNVTITGGPGGGTSGDGGAVTLIGGTPVAGAGGAVSITAAAGVGTNQNGGNVVITAGARTGSGTDGIINLVIPATGTLQVNGAAGTATQVLTSNGPSAPPTWQTATSSVSLSGITAAVGANSINNGDNAQTWNWALTTASKSAFTFTENTAAINGVGAQYLLDVSTIAASTANPIRIRAQGNNILTVTNIGVTTLQGADTGTGSAITIRGGNSSTAATAGANATVQGGTSGTSGTGGTTSVIGGVGGTTGVGGVVNITGGAGGGTSGNAGGVTIIGGTPVAGAGGAVSVSGSAGVGTNQAGGTASLVGGNATGTGVAGSVTITGGTAAGAGTGGTITMSAGSTTGGTNGTVIFNTAGTQRGQFTALGSLVLGNAAIATNATDGFLYITASAGTPTGVPTTFTGRAPVEVDSTNNLLYFYSGGAWRTSFAGGVTTFSAGTTGFTPNSPTAGAITLAGTLIAANGGTGFNTYAVGDLLYADTTTTLAKLPDVATGNALISGGVNTAPLWGKIGLTTHVSGTLGIGNGGTGTASTPTNGQILIGNGTNYTLSTITQTANQVTVTNGVGSITLSTPSTFIAPGTIASTTTITAGSNFIVSTATSSYTSTTGTAISVIPGAATNATSPGNILTLQGGPGGGTSGAGGAVTVLGGTPVAGAGGAINITAAAGVGTNQNGGNVVITAGARTGSGTDGFINLVIPATGTLQVNGAAGTANQVLTSAGAGAPPTWSSNGGLRLYAENPSAPTAPTVGGTNAVAIGNASSASGTESIVLGGLNNTSSAQWSSSFGSRAVAQLYGGHTQASGRFAADGDAQTSTLVLRTQTANATVTEAFLDGTGGTQRMVLPNDSTWTFDILVTARRTDVDNSSAGYRFVGVIDRNANAASTALVGAVSKTVIAEDVAAWDCNVNADTTNGSLRIQVTGAIGSTIRWVARATLVEVTG